MPETQNPHTTPLYRIENPNIPPSPNNINVVSHPELAGQWFSPSSDKVVLSYLHKSIKTDGRNSQPVDGAQLVVAHVPTDKLDSFHAAQHPIVIANKMDFETDDHLIPRDDSIPTDIIPLDQIIADLRGNLHQFREIREARRRIHTVLGKTAVK